MINRIIAGFSFCLATFAATAFRTDTISVATTHLATAGNVTVVVPDVAAPDNRVPSVYILNGYSGNNLDWVSREPRLGALADQYGMIFVMPDGRDSWYWNSPSQPAMQMESFFTDDLVPAIDSLYCTIAHPCMRAITGLSMGGQGAFWLGAHHPEIWSKIGSMSGGVDICQFPDRWKMDKLIGPYSDNRELWYSMSVPALVPLLQQGNFDITFDCGVDDFFAEVNDNLHRTLVEAKVPHDYTSRPGNHSWPYWRNSLRYHLLFFSEAFKKSEQ